jgi:hypothetical protein
MQKTPLPRVIWQFERTILRDRDSVAERVEFGPPTPLDCTRADALPTTFHVGNTGSNPVGDALICRSEFFDGRTRSLVKSSNLFFWSISEKFATAF